MAARGIEAVPAIWDDAAHEWTAYDLVVIRSTWDYPDRREQFLAWAESLPAALNAPEVLRWNTDKRYLEALGVDTVPTEFIEPGNAIRLPNGPFVVKPTVGAGSIGAARYAAADDRALAHVEALHAEGKTVMVQPYVEAVDSEGEVALMYLAGELSHAVRKAALLRAGAEPELTLLSGRYEGFDERVHEHLASDVVSIGPYVLTGGELAAMVVCDAVLRKLPGALGDEESSVEESFSQALGGAPEYPHYTRPADWRGHAVPDVLLSGDHAKVREWRLARSRERSLP